MKYPIVKFKSLEVALKELEPFVRNGNHLSTGRPFRKFGGMRSREALANWLLCVALNEDRPDGRCFTFTSDPLGSDGLIVYSATGDAVAQTEHAMVAKPPDHDDRTSLKTLILREVEQKRKKGDAYASGKTLVIFLNARVPNLRFLPNEVASQLPDPLYFKAVWVVGLEMVEGREYVYNVVHLDISGGDAPVVRVRIAEDFTSWKVERVQ
jgi:hypothetical protein